MHEIAKRFILTRAQPLAIISGIFLLDIFGIHIISAQASLIFTDIRSLSLLLIANFCFFLILDWKNNKSPAHLRSISIIYVLFVGYITSEIVAIYAGGFYAIFSEAKAVTFQQLLVTVIAILYNLVGGFFFEVYIFFIPNVTEKIQSVLKSRKRKTRTRMSEGEKFFARD